MRRLIWVLLLLFVTGSPGFAANEEATLFYEGFEFYQAGTLALPWDNYRVPGGWDSSVPGRAVVVSTQAMEGKQALQILRGAKIFCAHMIPGADSLWQFALYVPKGMPAGNVFGAAYWGGIRLLFQGEPGETFTVRVDAPGGPQLTGLQTERWQTIEVRIDHDQTLAELAGNGIAAGLFPFIPTGRKGFGHNLSLESKATVKDKAFFVDELILKKASYDFVSDHDKDGRLDQDDDDDDNDGVADSEDGCPFDPSMIFKEDWEAELVKSKWTIFGVQHPQVREGEGRDGSRGFDANGVASSKSWINSVQKFHLNNRPQLAFWAKGNSSKDSGQAIQVAWTAAQGPVAKSQKAVDGAPAAAASLVSLNILPDNAKGRFRFCVAGECGEKRWHDAVHDNVWAYYQVRINPDDTVSFYRDGAVQWSSSKKLDLQHNLSATLTLAGQSNDKPQLVDDLVVTLPAADKLALPGWRLWQERRDTGAPQAFYTANQSWANALLTFDFMLSAAGKEHASATLYAADDKTTGKAGYRCKVTAVPDGLAFECWHNGGVISSGTLAYPFKANVPYRGKLDARSGSIKVYTDGVLTAAVPLPPTQVEANLLGVGEGVLLNWMLPDDPDVSHVRIYRSVTPDRLGELLADRLTGSSYIDKAVDVETNYVYTVRAVNRLGTESAANHQLAVAVGTPAAEVDKPSRAFGELLPPQVRGRQLMFVTVPLVPEQEGALADYNRYDHQVMHWDPATDSWLEDANTRPGQAYFIWSNGKNVQEITGKEVPQRPFPIELKKGWNMVGNPFRFPVKLAELSVTADDHTVSLHQADNDGWLTGTFFVYRNDQWETLSVKQSDATLPSWSGVFILAERDCTLTVPPVPAQDH